MTARIIKAMTRAFLLLILTAAAAAAQNDTAKRLKEANDVLKEMMGADDKAIPQELLDNATCVAVIPGVKKAAFLIGGKFGRGFLTCRNANGVGWKSPAAMRVEGGSVGFQVGGSESDFIMIVKNAKGAEKLMSSRFTLGGEANVAAGPVGRNSTAQTDAQMRAEILSWSRSRGVFAGASIEGATLREDAEANKELYGKEMTTKEVMARTGAAPAAAKPMLATLSKYSGRAGKKS
jgi:lipid-binding SYLF domain-containing protein